MTYEQTKPYLYLAFRWRGFELHYERASSNVDPALENTRGCLVMVDTVAPYHAAFAEAMRRTYGKLLAKGLPRITFDLLVGCESPATGAGRESLVGRPT